MQFRICKGDRGWYWQIYSYGQWVPYQDQLDDEEVFSTKEQAEEDLKENKKNFKIWNT